MKAHWQQLQPNSKMIADLTQALDCHSLVAAILINRGITAPSAALSFWRPSLEQIADPFSLVDMDQAVERLLKAIIDRERILIFGDYDVDGVTATAVLVDFLRATNSSATYYIPHRTKEGYGLARHQVKELAQSRDISLIVTVDCGIGSHEAVRDAAQRGIDVIVTDHHQLTPTLPQAIAVVNPKRSPKDRQLNELAGVGVAFFLLLGLRQRLRQAGFWQKVREPNLKAYCDLVALGTVADMVPLRGQNRILARAGLQVINTAQRDGISALAQVAKLDAQPIGAEDIAFRIGPRINAAGRMAHAALAVDLLTSADGQEAEQMANRLDALNRQRRQTEQHIFDEIQAYLASHPQALERAALVLAGARWHQGLLGIVASRLVRQYNRPAVIIAKGSDGIAKGSARSVSGLNLYTCLSACEQHLQAFGGHAMAAGLTLAEEQIDIFRYHFEQAVKAQLPDGPQIATLEIDAQINFKSITPSLMDDLERLQPYGVGNAEPLWLANHVTVKHATIVGHYHQRLVLQQGFGQDQTQITGIRFNIDPGQPVPRFFKQCLFHLRWNYFQGSKKIQAIVVETNV
jgi:single-stranded-DNA-specific exonuclease